MVRFGRISPSVYVWDMQRALDFYCETLDFAVGFTNGSPMSFALIKRDEAELHLALRSEGAGSCHAHILLDDLDSVYSRLVAAGAQVRQTPKFQEWGLRDIVVADPDGNTFEFAERTEQARQAVYWTQFFECPMQCWCQLQ